MAKVNPVKLKQDADKEEKAGRLDKAIDLYRQLLQANPRDWNTINKIGDLYAKLNRTREAGQEYAKVADFYARDGFLLKAIAIWKKINRLDASALDPYLKLADLYAKQGLLMEAKSQFQIVLDEYLKKGKAREAADVLRRMVDIDAGDLKLQSRLAELYMRMGKKPEAIGVYTAIADQLNQKGHLAEAVQVLQKGLKIDSSSTQLRLELARIHIAQKNFDKAVSFLEEASSQAPEDPAILAQLGEAYLGSKKVDDAERIFRRLVDVDPRNQENRIQMGRLYLAKGDLDGAFDEFAAVAESFLEREEPGRAIALLEELQQRDPNHVKSLLKLVEIHRIQKNDPLVISTYSKLTEAYLKRGETEQAVSVLEILVEMEPQNAQHKTKLEHVRGRLGAGAPGPPAPATFLEAEPELDLGLGLDIAEAAPSAPILEPEPAAPPPAPMGAAVPQRPKIELSGALSDEDQEFIEEHLAEGRVFRKYGLVDKAADQFLAVVARFPDHAETREELREVYKEKGENAEAAEQCLALAEICKLKGDVAKARDYEDEARGLAPELARPAAPAPVPPVPEPEVAVASPAPPEPVLEAEVEEELTIGTDVGAEEELAPIGLEPESEEISLGPGLEVEEEEESLDLSLDEPAPAAVLPGPAPERTPTLPPQQLHVPQEDRPTTVPLPALPPALEKALADVDQYVALGFVDDAKQSLQRARTVFPDHPAIERKMSELGISEELPGDMSGLGGLVEEPPPFEIDDSSPLAALGDLPAPEPPAALEGDGLIDLGAEFGDILSAQSAVEEPVEEAISTDLGDLGLTEIFKEFRRGVDKQLGQEDFDTRYNLGIAYKEMGLVDEAIAEFQLAAKDPGRQFECSSMLGICFMEKGMPDLAVNWFEKGLRAEGRSPDEYNGLRYDLAAAYEANGSIDRALDTYTELYAQDAGFRDVASKLRELKAASP